MNEFLISALIGSIVGTLSGWIGISGSIYIELGLLLSELVKTQSKAAGTTLFAMVLPIVAPAVFSYYKRGEIDIKNGLIICAFYALLAGLGAKLNVLFSQKLTLNLAGVLQLIAAGIFFYQGYKKK